MWKAEIVAWRVLMASFVLAVLLAAWQRAAIESYIVYAGRDASLERAQGFEADGELDAAAALYARLAARYGGREEVQLAYAGYLERHKDIKDAEPYYARAAALGGLESPGVRGYAEFLVRQDRRAEAIALYAEHVSVYPGDAKAQCRLGTLLLARGEAEKALGCFRKAAANPGLRFEAARGEGDSLYSLGQPRKAIDAWERAARMASAEPGSALLDGAERHVLWQDIARAQADLGAWQAAMEAWSRYLDFFPDSWAGLRAAIEAAVEARLAVDPAWTLRLAAWTPQQMIEAPVAPGLLAVGVTPLAGDVRGGVLRGEIVVSITQTAASGEEPRAAFALRGEDGNAVPLEASLARIGNGPLWRGTSLRQGVALRLPESLAPGKYTVTMTVDESVDLWEVDVPREGAP